uniref:Uncharacterized protein n=1 Tax=Laticauda laticaudata TaxID=8630 RepID=A0A8C5SEI0_LATLA
LTGIHFLRTFWQVKANDRAFYEQPQFKETIFLCIQKIFMHCSWHLTHLKSLVVAALEFPSILRLLFSVSFSNKNLSKKNPLQFELLNYFLNAINFFCAREFSLAFWKLHFQSWCLELNWR